jgi:hypothetical protein
MRAEQTKLHARRDALLAELARTDDEILVIARIMAPAPTTAAPEPKAARKPRKVPVVAHTRTVGAEAEPGETLPLTQDTAA